MKKRSKGKIVAIAILLVAALAVNIACASLNSMITAWMGVNLNPMVTGSKASASAEILSVADATEQSMQMAETLEAEGIVLLKNDNAALPLASGTKVNLFGYGSVDPIYGGTGSGSGDTSKNVDVVKGLSNAGLVVNEELVKFYQNSGVSRPKQGGYSGSNFTPAEVPASAYTDAVLQQAKDFSDVAIVVFSRIGGEGGDLPMDMFAAGYSKTDDGRHYLELTQDEEDLLNLVKAQGFGKVIVLINSSNTMELGFADGVDACVWVGSPGAVGFNAVGEVLSGTVNPSGRLVDTYAYDLTSSPAYWNAGDFTYGNLKRNYVEYAEGIYVGYRYYETAAADGFIDYEKTVQYPFGYGLSYTTFTQEIAGYSDGNGTIAMQVKVTNTGSVAGKDVVQVYYTAPYTKGGIEKAHVALIGFAKTKELAPNESETVTIAFKAEDMASFDAFGAGCYVLEAGDYEIKLMNNAHTVIDSRTYTVKETITYGEDHARSTDKTAAVAHFADVQNGQITVYTSRSDWAGTTPTARADGKTASDAVVKAFSEKAPYEVNAADPAIVYADHGLTLTDMAGLDWNDPKWEQLLEQLSDEDMAAMILNGGWSTPAVASVGKPATSDLDGPAGINSLVSSLRGVSFPSEVVIGSTWNEPLVEEFGKVFGQEAAANGVVGLYAPGMNIHRTPFSGRNFEYFAEDGFLSGKLGAAEVRGAKTQGVYLYAKHFALNDQESNRLSISVWANEQAIRELYLKPFELTVKEGNTTAIMSSYSHLGTTWAGASKALLTDVLRGEWGFTGMVVTDSAMGNTVWMDPNLAVRAGNDMMLCLMGASIETDNNTARNAMRAACHNILYTQANSAAVQVEADNTPYWYAL
ncbi:MAG: glycoside hydrolase family 3 protein, partial [Clostridia bacterium]|nr:glycoside hydrolase family 3 protein [Clostridia bacterium]